MYIFVCWAYSFYPPLAYLFCLLLVGHLCHPKETIFVCVERSSVTLAFKSSLFGLARWSVGGGACVQTRGSEFPSQIPGGGRSELTPESCPLTPTCVVEACACTYTQIVRYIFTFFLFDWIAQLLPDPGHFSPNLVFFLSFLNSLKANYFTDNTPFCNEEKCSDIMSVSA